MTYTDREVADAMSELDTYRMSEFGEISSALAVVGLSSAHASKEIHIRDSMIRVAHDAGASLRQIAHASGLNRKAVTAIVFRQGDRPN